MRAKVDYLGPELWTSNWDEHWEREVVEEQVWRRFRSIDRGDILKIKHRSRR